LTALELARDTRSLDLRVFSTIAEAEADPEPQRPGTTMVRTVTGVPRSRDATRPGNERYRVAAEQFSDPEPEISVHGTVNPAL
jgi:hypothetical protein